MLDSSRHRTRSFALALFLLLIGELMLFHPVLPAPLRRELGGGVDSRLVHFMLEYEHACGTGQPICRGLWDTPSFYPEPNVAALTENLLGVYPLYAIWRLVGAPETLAFTLWAMTLAAANFVAFALFARRGLGLAAVPALVAAFLFAFAAPRANQFEHLHLWTQFPTVLALWALALELRQPRESNRRRYVYACLAALVWQLYSGLYLTWLAAFVGTLVLVAALLQTATRRALLASAQSRGGTWVLGGLAALALAAPLVLRQWLGAAGHAWSGFEQILQPDLYSWHFLGERSWLYGQMAWWPPIAAATGGENTLGVGPVTTIAALAGLWSARRSPWARAAAVGAAAAGLLVTGWPGGVSAWRLLFPLVPGAESLRAIGRVIFVILPVIAVGLALAVAAMKRRPALALALVGACLLEQGVSAPITGGRRALRRSQQLAARLPPDCQAFFYSVGGTPPGPHPSTPALDAMWASLAAGVPTLNGHSGYEPGGWRLWETHVESARKEEDLRQALDQWRALHALSDEQVCWVHQVFDEDGRSVSTVRLDRLGPLPAGARPP